MTSNQLHLQATSIRSLTVCQAHRVTVTAQ